MVCKYCGYDIGGKAKFCENCGAALSDEDIKSGVSSFESNDSNNVNKQYKAQSQTQSGGTYGAYTFETTTCTKQETKQVEDFFNIPKINNTYNDSYSETKRTEYIDGDSPIDILFGGIPTISGATQVVKNVFSKKKTKKIIIGVVVGFIVLAIIVALCNTLLFNDNQLDISIEAYDKILIGMSYDDVLEIMGADGSNEVISNSNGYRYKVTTWKDSSDNSSRSIVVHFENDYVVDKKFIV